MTIGATSSSADFSSENEIKENYTNRLDVYITRLLDILNAITKEINYPYPITAKFSVSIDPLLAYVDDKYLNVCPLFVLDLSEIPQEIRPQGWDDPHLCDLKYLQRLSDWIADEFKIAKQKVSFIEAAAAKTIIKLKLDPQGIKALRAGAVHELGHIALEHNSKTSSNRKKSNKQKEKEADLYAVKKLKDGFDGIKIGFDAWQKSLQCVRESPHFCWKDRMLMRLLITAKGNGSSFLYPWFF